MTYQNYLIDAIDVVCSWDIPDEVLGEAVSAQACYMAHINQEDVFGCME